MQSNRQSPRPAIVRANQPAAGLPAQSAGPTAPPFSYPLEALRGVVALLVVLGHALAAGPPPDPHYRPGSSWQYAPPGHLGVLVFFMLSGYVIGLSNPLPLSTNGQRWRYLQKRWVRLYPLYVVALLATAAITALYHAPVGPAVWGGYLFFGQGWAVPMPGYNTPLWSLPYEISYYLFFLAVSVRRWPAGWLAGAFVGLGLLGTALHVQPAMLVSVAYGGVFWLLGLALARCPRREGPPAYGTMLAFLLLLLSYQRLNLGYTTLHLLGFDLDETKFNFFERPITFSDLSYLLVCWPLLACFAHRAAPGQRWLERAAFLVPGLYLVGYGATGRLAHPFASALWLSVVFYGLALGAYLGRRPLQRVAQAAVRRLGPLGAVSYAVYIIHLPLLALLHRVQFFSGTAGTLLVRLGLYFGSVLAVSWVLERRVQPWLKKKLIGAN